MVSHDFPLVASFLTLSTLWKKMEIAKKEGGLPVFDINVLNSSVERAPSLDGNTLHKFFSEIHSG